MTEELTLVHEQSARMTKALLVAFDIMQEVEKQFAGQAKNSEIMVAITFDLLDSALQKNDLHVATGRLNLMHDAMCNPVHWEPGYWDCNVFTLGHAFYHALFSPDVKLHS